MKEWIHHYLPFYSKKWRRFEVFFAHLMWWPRNFFPAINYVIKYTEKIAVERRMYDRSAVGIPNMNHSEYKYELSERITVASY